MAITVVSHHHGISSARLNSHFHFSKDQNSMSGSTHLLLQVTGLMRGWVTRRPCLKKEEEEKKQLNNPSLILSPCFNARKEWEPGTFS